MNNKVNAIFLVNLPGPTNDHNFHKLAYDILEDILCENYHEYYNIILIRYALCSKENDAEQKRALQLFIVREEKKLEELINFGNIKFTEPNFLGILFCYINSRFHSEETVLFVWGHGYGVGIFKDFNKLLLLNSDNKFLAKDFFVPISSPFLFSKKTRNLLSASDSGKNQVDPTPINDNDISDMLTITELNDSLRIGFREVFNGHKIKMLVFMNCDMMRFDNLYDLSFSADYIVGPQTPISWWGYDYCEFFNYLQTAPKSDFFWDNACKNLTENMHHVKVDEEFKDFVFLERTVIAAINSLFARELFSILNQLLMSVISDINSIEQWLILFNRPETSVLNDDFNDTSNSWAYNKNQLEFPSAKFDLRNFDFINLFRAFNLKISNPGILKDACEKLICLAEKKLVVCSYKGSNYPQLNGFSITYPRNIIELIQHPFFHSFMMPGSPTSDSFASESFWPEFVALMNKQTPTP